jgi:hypothetical protein
MQATAICLLKNPGAMKMIKATARFMAAFTAGMRRLSTAQSRARAPKNGMCLPRMIGKIS